MAETIVLKKLSYHLCAVRRFFYIPKSPLILHSHSTKILSRLVSSDTIVDTDGHLQNPFAHFAATKFNLSAADIARIFKFAPQLQKLQTLDKVEEFVGMLNKHGFKQHQIALIMKRQPRLVTISAERLHEPKLRLLEDFGIDREKLAIFLTRRPLILGLSFDRELLPKMTLLENIFQSKDVVIKALLKNPSILTFNLEKTLKPSLAFWEQCGFRGMDLARFLLTRPSILRCTSLTPAQDDLIHKIGNEKGTKLYNYVLGLVASSRMKTLEAKIHNFQLCGLSTDEIMEVIRVQPFALGSSTENVKQKMRFLVNNLELPANSVVKQPGFLRYNFEKVIKPRVLVLQEMNSMNRLGHLELKKVCTILKMSEAKFLSKIVGGHPESSTLYGIYEGAISDSSSSTKILRKAAYF